MGENQQQTYSAFDGVKLLAQGPLADVVIKVKRKVKADPKASILVFSDSTGKEMDFDLRGSEKEVLERLEVFLSQENQNISSGPGRPKLGVVAREVSLLPRHWEWLSTQSGGASATLRRLVEEASKTSTGRDQIKKSQESAYKFMSTMAGNFSGFEEAIRALFARDKKKFREQMHDWPGDIKQHALKLAENSFD